MKKQTYENLTCVCCHRDFKYTVDLENSVVSICHRPDCANYGLLAMPSEQMPVEEDDNARTGEFKAKGNAK